MAPSARLVSLTRYWVVLGLRLAAVAFALCGVWQARRDLQVMLEERVRSLRGVGRPYVDVASLLITIGTYGGLAALIWLAARPLARRLAPVVRSSCPSCGYHHAGPPGAACPECGLALAAESPARA